MLTLFLGLNPAEAGGAAQIQEQWRWVRFGLESGLPSELLRSVVETSDHTVWACTAGGIAWFDGFRWQAVSVDSITSVEFAEAYIAPEASSVLLCVRGRLFRVAKGGARRIPLEFHGAPLEAGRAGVIAPGEVLLQTGAGLFLLDSTGTRPMVSPPGILSDLQHLDGGSRLFPTSGGSVWINTSRNLYRWSGKEWIGKVPGGVSSMTCEGIDENRQGRAIAAVKIGRNLSVLTFKPGGGGMRRKPMEAGLLSGLAVGPEGEAFLSFKSGELLWGTPEEGWSSLTTVPERLRTVECVLFRNNGDLLVGTPSGLYVLRRSLQRWTTWKLPGTPAANNINEICRTSDGRIWLGTGDGIIVRDTSGRRLPIPSPLERGSAVTAVAEDPEGHVWIGSGEAFTGAYRWDGTRWDHVGIRQGLKLGLIHRIVRDAAGRLWFLGISPYMPGASPGSEPGAFVLEGGRFVHIGQENGLLDNRVYSFAEDRRGARYFGTATGLSRWVNGRWTHWTVREGLKHPKVFALAAGRDGSVWLAHQRDGIGVMDSTGTIKYFTTIDGLLSNEVWGVLADSLGRIWATTSQGLSCFDGKIWSSLTTQEGLAAPALWPLLLEGSRLYLGTLGGGVSILDLSATRGPEMNIIFTGIHADAGQQSLGWHISAWWGDIPNRRIECRYRFDQSAWSQWTLAREVPVTGLTWGKHTVRVEAKGFLGIAPVLGAECAFSTTPPFYYRREFYLPVLLLALFLSVTLFRYNIRRSELEKEIRRQDARYRAVVESQSEPQWRMTPAGAITFVNQAFCRFVREERERIVGRPVSDFLQGVSPGTVTIRLGDLQGTGRPFAEDLLLKNREGHPLWFHLSFTAIYGGGGVPMEIQAIAQDITARKEAEENLTASLKEKEVLLKEIHHRVKNNLQVISSLLNLQAREIRDASDRELFRESQNRIRSMALIHEKLYQSHNLARISFEEYARNLAGHLLRSYGTEGVQVEITPSRSTLDIDTAVPIGLILNELVSNAFKHAFPSGRQGKVVLSLKEEEDGACHLAVIDNGIGMPAEIDLSCPKSLGLQLVDVLVAQLKGSGRFETDGGTAFHLFIPAHGGGER